MNTELPIVFNGRTYWLDEENLRAHPLFAGQDHDALIAAGHALKAKLAARTQIRQTIKREVGDTASILGTTADGAQLAVAVALADIVALAGASSYTAYKTAKLEILSALAGVDHDTGVAVDVAGLAQDLITKIQSGEIKLTATLKGLVPTLTEIMNRATGVADIMISATTP